MPDKLQFDDGCARTYAKRAEVLAFRSDDSFIFEKSWGVQTCRAGSWLLVSVDAAGAPTGDWYGCDADVFEETYEPSPSRRPDRYRKHVVVRAYQPGASFEVETILADGHQETARAGTESDDAWIVRAPGGEIYPVENVVFARSYELVVETGTPYRIKTRDEHWRPDGGPKRILALDGGGVRGILTIGYLERIEALLKARHGDRADFRLCHYFDLIAGTSTGAIIAALLAMGKTVAEVRNLYEELAADVFRHRFYRLGIIASKFSARRLRRHLQSIFKNSTLGSAALGTGLLVVAKRLDTGSTWPITNNPSDRYFGPRDDEAYIPNEDYLLRAVVRASTAAPHYFGPEHIEIGRSETEVVHGVFVDGGVSPHNNPALLALQLATLDGFGLRWPLDPDRLLVVSAGTGAPPPDVSYSRIAGKHTFKALLSLMNDCGESVETMLQWLSDSPTARKIDSAIGTLTNDLLAERPLLEYVRYDVQLEEAWIARELGLAFGGDELARLAQMDQPSGMPRLAELGRKSAERHVRPEHFPERFDLG